MDIDLTKQEIIGKYQEFDTKIRKLMIKAGIIKKIKDFEFQEFKFATENRIAGVSSYNVS